MRFRPGEEVTVLGVIALLLVHISAARADEVTDVSGARMLLLGFQVEAAAGMRCTGEPATRAFKLATNASDLDRWLPGTVAETGSSDQTAGKTAAVFSPEPNRQLAISGCCKERRTTKRAWRRNGLSFDDCKAKNDDIDGDDVFARSKLIWWDIGC